MATDGHFLGYSTLVNRAKQSGLTRRMQRIVPVSTPMPEMVREIGLFRPDVLAGYATAIYLLAKEQLQGRLSIRPYAVMVSGEALHPYMRRAMEEAFGGVVIDNYGSSEAPGLAFECGHHKLHLNGDWHFLEPDDNRGVLVTNLSNRVQPIIRYRMSDTVTFDKGPCPCGSVFPSFSVVGREDEILSFVSAQGVTIEVAPLAIATVGEESDGVFQCQMAQVSPYRLEVKVKVLEGRDEGEVKNGVRRNLERFLGSLGLTNVNVGISPELPRANPKSGKFKAVARLVEKN